MSKYQMKQISEEGFTFIELLVVISIISLMASIAVSAFSISRTNSKNAQAVGNARAIQQALDLYYDDHGGYPYDPANPNKYVFLTAPDLRIVLNQLSPYLGTVPSPPGRGWIYVRVCCGVVGGTGMGNNGEFIVYGPSDGYYFEVTNMLNTPNDLTINDGGAFDSNYEVFGGSTKRTP